VIACEARSSLKSVIKNVPAAFVAAGAV